MKLTHLSTVSALALMLAIGGPATAQVTADQPADEPTVGQTQPGDQPMVGQTQPGDQQVAGQQATGQYGEHERMSVADLEELLGEIGIEDRELFAGQIVVGRTDDGNPVFMLIGPEDFERGELAEFDIEAFGDLREKLSDAGFEDARQDRTWQVFQGTLNGHHVFAASGDPDWGPDVAERDTGVADDTMAGVGTTQPQTGDTMAGTGTGTGIDQQRTDTMADTTQPQTGDTTAGVDTTRDMTQPQTGDTTAGIDTAPDMTQPQTGDTAAGIDTAPDMTQPQTGDTTAGVDSQPGIDGTAERGLGVADADQVTRALGGDFDRDEFEEKLGEAGIEDLTDFQGKLVYARTEDGQSIRLLIGPEGFSGDEEIELSEDELREKLEDAGLTSVQVIDENVGMFRGSYNDHSVLILGGMGITDGSMRMGAVQTGQDIDVTDIERPE